MSVPKKIWNNSLDGSSVSIGYDKSEDKVYKKTLVQKGNKGLI